MRRKTGGSMAKIIPIGHQSMTPADLRAIFEHSDALIAEGVVGEVTTQQHDTLGMVVSLLDREDELVCRFIKRIGRYEVYGGEGNLIRHAPLLRNALSILPAPLRHEPDAPAPRHSLSRRVNARLSGDRAVAIRQGGRPGRGFVAHS